MRHGRRGLCVVAAGALFVLVCALTGCAGTRLDGRSGDATDGSVRDVAGDTHSSDRGEPDDAGSTQDLASDLGAGDDPGAVDVAGDAARDGLTDGAGAACGGCLGAAYESCTDACVRAGYPGGLCTDPGGTSPARCCTCEAADFAVSGIEPGGYTVGTLAVGAPVYSDRDYTFADVGPFAGATYLLTANDDKYATGNEFLRFDVNLTARVRVGFDTRAAPPAWLGSWTLTGAGITTTDTLFDVYERLVDPGRVTLGGAGIGGGASMYTVVITAAPECLAGVCDDGSVPPPLDAGSDAAPDAGPDVAPDTPRDDGCGTYGDEPFMSWRFVGPVASGAQIDAVRGPGGRVHLISDRYFEFDCDGAVVVDEGVGDGHQGGLDFPPALAVGDDGTVHIVTRHDGDWNGGEDIRYRRRNASGGWDRDYIFGGRVKRNYVVGAAWAGPDAVYLSSSRGGSDVWGDLRIWSAGASGASELGAIGGVWRGDADSRMRGADGRVFLVSGAPNGGGDAAFFMHGNPGPALAGELAGSVQRHAMGSGRTGFPDVYADAAGGLHFTFGAHQEVYYNRYGTDGARAFDADRRVFSGLNEWHLSSGLSAVAASDDGGVVVAVALRSDGSQTAGRSDLLWSVSTDGGANWAAPQDTGHDTDGGEGRMRPRLVAVGRRFFLLYRDRDASGISLAMFDVAP